MSAIAALLAPLRRLHEEIRDDVVRACEAASTDALAVVTGREGGDTIYAVDRVGEERLVRFFEREVAPVLSLVLIAEGIENGKVVLPRGTSESDARLRVIVDPIDGTRGLMYQKRSAWILTGVALNRGAATDLADIQLAVQTEIPTGKQHLCDVLWAERGRGAGAERHDRVSGARRPLTLTPSRAPSIAHGFATVSKFVPGGRDILAAIEEEIIAEVLGPRVEGEALAFEDQYISSGGQLYELVAGHDRFVADLRPLLAPMLAARGEAPGLCCHPYDLSTSLIATEAGVLVAAPSGNLLCAPLDVHTNVAWVGYANDAIRRQVAPALAAALARRGLA